MKYRKKNNKQKLFSYKIQEDKINIPITTILKGRSNTTIVRIIIDKLNFDFFFIQQKTISLVFNQVNHSFMKWMSIYIFISFIHEVNEYIYLYLSFMK